MTCGSCAIHHLRENEPWTLNRMPCAVPCALRMTKCKSSTLIEQQTFGANRAAHAQGAPTEPTVGVSFFLGGELVTARAQTPGQTNERRAMEIDRLRNHQPFGEVLVPVHLRLQHHGLGLPEGPARLAAAGGCAPLGKGSLDSKTGWLK